MSLLPPRLPISSARIPLNRSTRATLRCKGRKTLACTRSSTELAVSVYRTMALAVHLIARPSRRAFYPSNCQTRASRPISCSRRKTTASARRRHISQASKKPFPSSKIIRTKVKCQLRRRSILTMRRRPRGPWDSNSQRTWILIH